MPITVVSARSVLKGATVIPIAGEYALVINAFQPATSLGVVSEPVSYVEHSLAATAHALAQVKDERCVRVIYTSSAVVYGTNDDCHESDPLRVTSLHGAMKICAEELVTSYCASANIDSTIIRLFNLFGGSDHFSVIQRLVNAVQGHSSFQLINHGESMRDYVHVNDAARSYRSILHGVNPGVVNVGSGKPVSVSTLLSDLRNAGHKVKIAPATRSEVASCIANTDLLEGYVDVSRFYSPADYLLDSVSS
jgi:UDP-glucose 4-epimerase